MSDREMTREKVLAAIATQHLSPDKSAEVDEKRRAHILQALDELRVSHAADHDRAQIAALMIAHGFTTGHGDTVADLLKELSPQLTQLRSDRDRLREALEKAADAMDSVTVFVTSRERINKPTGEAWWAMERTEARQALSPKEP